MAKWIVNADVAIEIEAEDEDAAREMIERVIEETAGTDSRLVSAFVAAFIFGPEELTAEEATNE